MNIIMDLTLENFTERTGSRFRVSKLQAARIALTELSDEARQSLVGATIDQAADILGARNSKGNPLNWVETAIELVTQGWNDTMTLTREGAFQEFLSEGGLDRLQNRRPDIPDSVYLDPELTLSNFSDKVKEAIGVARRFRVSGEQYQRISAGELTREQALAEVIASKRAAAEAADIKVVKLGSIEENRPATEEEIEAALTDENNE